jgi:hypothetical protein
LDQFIRDRHFRRGVGDFRRTNFQTVAVYFLTFKMSAPHAVLIVVIYVLGMVTGVVWERWCGKHLKAHGRHRAAVSIKSAGARRLDFR